MSVVEFGEVPRGRCNPCCMGPAGNVERERVDPDGMAATIGPEGGDAAVERIGPIARVATPLAVVVQVVVALVALGVAVTGVLLTDVYRPVGFDGGASPLPPALERSLDVVRWHELGQEVLVGAALTGLVLVAAAQRPRRPSSPVPALGAFVGLASSIAAAVSWPLVRWEQLALRAVTVGTELDGLWEAAFGEGILFVIVGGREVSQASVAVWLVVHLVMPAVVLVAATVTTASLVRRHPDVDHARHRRLERVRRR